MAPAVETLPADHDLLIRLDQKLDSHIAEVRQNNANFTFNATDHETRIRVLERDADQQKGTIRTLKYILTALGVVAAIADPLLFWIKKGQ